MGYAFALRNQTPASVTVLVKRINHFRLFALTIFTTDSHVFTIPTIWHLPDHGYQEGAFLTVGSPEAVAPFVTVVRAALYSCP
ncbi:MAG: hypothetical protein ACPGSM_18485 [Thiolinea sp.]